MDALNTYGLVAGLVIAVLSAGASFFNRQRYKTLITDIYQPGNDELRSQLATVRQEKEDCDKAGTEWRTKYEEQEKYIGKLEALNQRLPDFASLTEVINNNHTQVMNNHTELMTVLTNATKKKAKK